MLEKTLMFASTNRDHKTQKRVAASSDLQIKKDTKKSLESHFRDMIFHRFFSGRVVFLYGTSTAGKSSIVNFFKNNVKATSHHLVVTGTDIVWGLHIFDLFVKYSFKKSQILRSYFTIEEIFDCIWNPLFAAKLINAKSISTEKKNEITNILHEFRFIQKDLLKDLVSSKRPFFCASSFLFALSLGKTVIVDTAADVGDLEEFHQTMAMWLVHCRIDTVMVYCSPKKLIERLYARNAAALNSASINQSRPGAFPLIQYSVAYEKTNFPSQAIDSISFADIQIPRNLPKICKTLFELIAEQVGDSTEPYDEAEWVKAHDLIQKSFDLNLDGDNVYIKPKCNYQFVVNTGENDAKSCAETIRSTLRI